MKRILIVLFLINVFFTGCSMLPEPIEASVWTQEALDEKEVDLKIEQEGEQAEQEQQDEQAARFQNMTGPRAFYFPSSHDVSSGSLGNFKVLALKGSCFYYLYDTVYGEPSDTNEQRVRALMKHDYLNHSYQILYERIYDLPAEETVTAEYYGQYIEHASGDDQLFLYDQGYARIFTTDGTAVFERDLNQVLDVYLPIGDMNKNSGILSRDITNVVMDGQDTIYLEVSLSDQDLDETAEEDDVEDDEVESYVLYYRYSLLNHDKELFYSEYVNSDKAIQEWIDMADGETFSSEPDSLADFAKACEQHDVKWEPYHLAANDTARGIAKGSQLYQWDKEGEQFKRISSIWLFPTMIPEEDACEPVMQLEKGQSLWPDTGGVSGADGVFFMQNGNYCKITGTVHEVDVLKHLAYSRTFTVEEEDEDGNISERTVTQRLSGVPACRTASFTGKNYVEEVALSFYRHASCDDYQNVILYRDDEGLLIQNDGESSQTLNGDGDVFLLNAYGGTYEPQNDIVTVTTKEDETTFEKEQLISILFRYGKKSWSSYGQLKSDDLYFSMLKKSDSEDDQEILSSVRSGGGNVTLYSDSESYSTENLLVHYDNKKAAGVLATTLSSGIVYAQVTKSGLVSEFERYYQYINLPMYQTWQIDAENFISIGFPENGDFSREDIVYARVYEFDLNREKLETESYQKRYLEDGKRKDSEPKEKETEPEMPELSDDLKQQLQKFESKEYETNSGTDYSTAEQTLEVLQGELESMWNERE